MLPVGDHRPDLPDRPVLEARSVSYHREGRTRVRQVSLQAGPGELLMLCGPQGAGTSALLRLLAGGLIPDAGRVLHDGRAPRPDQGLEVVHGAPAARRALVTPPEPGRAPVLLLDEPTRGAPDAEHDRLVAECRRWAEAGAVVVLTSHDLPLVARHAHTAALLVAGRLIAWASPAVAFVPAVRLLGYGGSPTAGGAPGPGVDRGSLLATG